MPQYEGCAFYYERTMTLADDGSNNNYIDWIVSGANHCAFYSLVTRSA